jgi:hypothetical protein
VLYKGLHPAIEELRARDLKAEPNRLPDAKQVDLMASQLRQFTPHEAAVFSTRRPSQNDARWKRRQRQSGACR